MKYDYIEDFTSPSWYFTTATKDSLVDTTENRHNHPSSSSTTVDPSTSLLLIGDSVDLFFLYDWCRNDTRRSLCRAYPQGDRLRGAIYNQQPTDNCTLFLRNLEHVIDPNQWKQSYAPSYCYDPVQHIHLVMFWQNLGVYPVPPFHVEITQYSRPPPTTVDMDTATALRLTLAPIIRDAPILLGNRTPDGIVFQSSFWELYKLAAYRLPFLQTMRIDEETRVRWTTEWIQNMSIYTDIVKDLTQKWSSVVWYGTRTANLPTAKKRPDMNWRYDAVDIILLFNRYVYSLGTSKGIGIIDFERITGYNPGSFLRDDHHPRPPFMVAGMEAIIEEVQKVLVVPMANENRKEEKSTR